MPRPKKSANVIPALTDLRSMLDALKDLRKKETELEIEIQKRAKECHLEALGVVDLCTDILGKKPARRVQTGGKNAPGVFAAKLTATGQQRGRGDRIVAFLNTQSEPITTAGVSRALTDDSSEERVRVGVALSRLVNEKRIVRVSRGLWQAGDAKHPVAAKGPKPPKAPKGVVDKKDPEKQNEAAISWARARVKTHPDDFRARQIFERNNITE